jgi:hypothetical protein
MDQRGKNPTLRKKNWVSRNGFLEQSFSGEGVDSKPDKHTGSTQ